MSLLDDPLFVLVEHPISFGKTSHYRSKMGSECHTMLTLSALLKGTIMFIFYFFYGIVPAVFRFLALSFNYFAKLTHSGIFV